MKAFICIVLTGLVSTLASPQGNYFNRGPVPVVTGPAYRPALPLPTPIVRPVLPPPAYGPPAIVEPIYPDGPAQYDFSYAVNDQLTGTNFGHSESRDGYNTQGSYHVALPDGRLQTVDYHADDVNGYVADVKYAGEPIVPAYAPAPIRPIASYAPAPVALPAPAPVFRPAPPPVFAPAPAPVFVSAPAPVFRPALPPPAPIRPFAPAPLPIHPVIAQVAPLRPIAPVAPLVRVAGPPQVAFSAPAFATGPRVTRGPVKVTVSDPVAVDALLAEDVPAEAILDEAVPAEDAPAE